MGTDDYCLTKYLVRIDNPHRYMKVIIFGCGVEDNDVRQ